MNSYLVYRASFYLMLVVATLALSGTDRGGPVRQVLHPGRGGRGSRRFLHGRSPPAVGLAAPAGQCPGRRYAGRCSTSSTSRRYPDDPGAGSLAGLSATDQVLPAQDGRGRLVPLPAGTDAGPDRLGRQPERPGRHMAVPVGDAGRLGAGPVFLATRGAPALAPSQNVLAGPASATRSVDPYRGLFDLPYVAGDGPRHGDDARPGRAHFPGPAAPARGRPAVRPLPRWPGT